MPRKILDLTGHTYGRLTVLEEASLKITKAGKKLYMWKCRCECGNTTELSTTALRSGNTTSCGCYRLERNLEAMELKLEGLTFGRLLVIKQVEKHPLPSGKNLTKWLCKCECGNTTEVIGRDLKSGNTKSCGCLASKGEEQIIDILLKNNIRFETQKTFKECYYKNSLRFDFFLPDINILIEYQGPQHYRPVDFGSKGKEWANSQFKYNLEKDNIKRKFAKSNNIKLIEIPYTKFDELEEYILTIIKENKVNNTGDYCG